MTSPRDGGATAVEYSFLVVAIAAIIVIVVFALGRITKSSYTSACTNWNTAAGTSGGC
jgi:Flp pilus assembly pilin Flp